jgi:hypothetical protein
VDISKFGFIIAPVCLLIGSFLALYIKDKVRIVMREEFKSVFSEFKDSLLKEIDKTYRRSGECALINDSLHDRLDMIDERLKTIEDDSKKS